MVGWCLHEGLAVSLPQENVDTDQLIPARYMSISRADGYGPYLFYDMRRDENGTLRENFVLNRHKNTTVIVARRGFGSGSSREAAVYALMDAGIRAVVAPSFGDIFAANCINNGLLPACLDEKSCAALENALANDAKNIRIDITARAISLSNIKTGFSLDDSWATKLINGWDDIDLTMDHAAEIAAYKDARSRNAPWAWPVVAD